MIYEITLRLAIGPEPNILELKLAVFFLSLLTPIHKLIFVYFQDQKRSASSILIILSLNTHEGNDNAVFFVEL